MVFYAISSKIDEILSINPSANVFVFGDFNVHHKDWPIYSGGTDAPGELCHSFSILRWLTFQLFWQSLCFGFISTDPSICSTAAFPPLRNSDHVVVLVSIDFPSNAKKDVPFHNTVYDYSPSDLDGLHDYLRDIQ